ncbi:MAG: ChbG/HpnK family deacetylase [Kiritimatiellaeota bacterium]|nr:ChbG/HpnK family deacetylase [Kiritimatiellota bacterium]
MFSSPRFPTFLGLTLQAMSLAAAAAAKAPGAETPPAAPGETALIVHADDLGMCHSANAAGMKALETGIVTSASVMVPCPWFPEMATWARRHPKADLGLHLTLTSEWEGYRWGPVAARDRVPGLVDPDGYLWGRVADVVRHASADEVEVEVRAQIERALAAGMRPTHLDTHMGTLFASEAFYRVYIRLSREYGIPAMTLKPGPVTRKVMAANGVKLSEEAIALPARYGIPGLDMLYTGVEGKTYDERKAAWFKVLDSLRPGVNQIIIHVAGNDPEIQHVTHSWRNRWNEFRIFTDPETRDLLRKRGIRLMGWRPMHEQMSPPRPAGRGQARKDDAPKTDVTQ